MLWSLFFVLCQLIQKLYIFLLMIVHTSVWHLSLHVTKILSKSVEPILRKFVFTAIFFFLHIVWQLILSHTFYFEPWSYIPTEYRFLKVNFSPISSYQKMEGGCVSIVKIRPRTKLDRIDPLFGLYKYYTIGSFVYSCKLITSAFYRQATLVFSVYWVRLASLQYWEAHLDSNIIIIVRTVQLYW